MSANEVSEVSKLKHIIEDLERQLTSLRFDYKRAVEDAAHLKDRKFIRLPFWGGIYRVKEKLK